MARQPRGGQGFARHVRSPDFRSIYADSAMTRLNGNNIQITLLSDEREISGESYRISEDGKLLLFEAVRDVGPVRVQECMVRLPVAAALGVAFNILQIVKNDMPGLLDQMKIEVEQVNEPPSSSR